MEPAYWAKRAFEEWENLSNQVHGGLPSLNQSARFATQESLLKGDLLSLDFNETISIVKEWGIVKKDGQAPRSEYLDMVVDSVSLIKSYSAHFPAFPGALFDDIDFYEG